MEFFNFKKIRYFFKTNNLKFSIHQKLWKVCNWTQETHENSPNDLLLPKISKQISTSPRFQNQMRRCITQWDISTVNIRWKISWHYIQLPLVFLIKVAKAWISECTLFRDVLEIHSAVAKPQCSYMFFFG